MECCCHIRCQWSDQIILNVCRVILQHQISMEMFCQIKCQWSGLVTFMSMEWSCYIGLRRVPVILDVNGEVHLYQMSIKWSCYIRYLQKCYVKFDVYGVTLLNYISAQQFCSIMCLWTALVTRYVYVVVLYHQMLM